MQKNMHIIINIIDEKINCETLNWIKVMLWKYGGFYLDLDYVVFNDLSQFENIVVGNGE